MLLITLRIYATGGMQRTIADLNGVVHSTVCKIVTKVTHYIAMLSENFIRFPNTKEELERNKIAFYNTAKFPKVIAALDCTHVKIISPGIVL